MRTIILRELLIASRAGSGAALALAFFVLVVVVSALGLGRDPVLLTAAAPGTIWTGALLATLLSLDRLFQADFEDGSLDALLLAPIPQEATVLAKIIAHWLTTGLPLVIASPLMALMLNFPASHWPVMIFSLAVGTIGFSSIGGIGAAITLGVRRGGLLLSLLTMPLYVPTLIFGVVAVQNAAAQRPFLTPLLMLAGVSLASLVLAPLAAAAAVRIHSRG